MALTVTSFDSFSVNASTGYKLILNSAQAVAPWTMTPTVRPRLSQYPVIDAVTFEARRLPFVIQKTDSSISSATFKSNVVRYFSPDVAAARTLLATHDDAVTTLQASAYVATLQEVPNAQRFVGEFLLPDPFWKATSDSTDSASPLTNGGTIKALPVITITPSGTTLLHRRVTITDGGTRGLANYLVRITFDSTGVSATTAADYEVFHQGRRVPFFVQTLNNASTTLDVRVDVPPAGSSYVDIFYGSSVNNTVTANQLDDGGMNLASGSFSNTNWVWDDFAVPALPAATGSWRLAKMGQTISGVSYGIVSYDGTTLKFGLRRSTDPALANDYDGIILTVGSQAGTTNALSGLSRDDVASTIGAVAGSYTMKIAYRTAGSLTWTVAWHGEGGAAVTSAVDLDNAVEIAAYVEPLAADAVMDFELKASGTFQLALTATPTVSVGASATAYILSGTLTNSTTGDTITFPTTYIETGTLTIDCAAKRITASAGYLFNPPYPSDPDDWLKLAVGSNSWTDPTGGASAFAWRNRYSV